MASTYEYCTLTELEAFAGIDYSSIDGTKYADANVEAKITLAERVVNAKTTPSGGSHSTVSDSVKTATIIMSMRIMNNTLIEDGYWEGTPVQVLDVMVMDLLSSEIYSPIDLIPMQGVDR